VNTLQDHFGSGLRAHCVAGMTQAGARRGQRRQRRTVGDLERGRITHPQPASPGWDRRCVSAMRLPSRRGSW
jgi:hypothetical protein